MLSHFLKKFSSFLKHNLVLLALFFSIFGVGIGIFNTYQIKNIGTDSPLPKQVKIENPDKILKEIPKGAPVLGDPNAKITIIEFSDFQCPFCGKFFTQTFPEIKKLYIDTGKAKLVYLDFAFLGEESTDAARAAKCAGEQGKFWEYHDELFYNQKGENQGAFNKSNLKKFAAEINLNSADFENCIAGTKYNKLIFEEQALGRKYGISGTPGFIIGDQLIKGAYPIEYFKQAIEGQL
ncbi:MAG TPA: DsbA family protein [Candidatus Paceibacterota bacterium]